MDVKGFSLKKQMSSMSFLRKPTLGLCILRVFESVDTREVSVLLWALLTCGSVVGVEGFGGSEVPAHEGHRTL